MNLICSYLLPCRVPRQGTELLPPGGGKRQGAQVAGAQVAGAQVAGAQVAGAQN